MPHPRDSSFGSLIHNSADEFAAAMRMDDRRQRTAGEHIVDDAEIVEYLERAGLDPIASRAREELCCLVDDPDFDPAAGEIDLERYTAGPAPAISTLVSISAFLW
jgi:hypothetical protein